MSRCSCAVALVALALLVGPAPATAAAPPRVKASVEPATFGVGDPLVVRVDVSVADGDPDEVRVDIDPGPLTALSAPRVERLDGRVRASQRLACLSLDCVPGERARDLTLPPVLARVGGVSVLGPRVRVRVVPRVPAAALEPTNPPFRRTTTPPPPSYRVAPGRLGDALHGAAAGLALVALALVAVEVRRKRRHLLRTAADPLARAIRLVRESAARSTSDRRRALGLLARVLAERDAVPLAEAAQSVAWSAQPPDSRTANALAREVQAVAGSSRGQG